MEKVNDFKDDVLTNLSNGFDYFSKKYIDVLARVNNLTEDNHLLINENAALKISLEKSEYKLKNLRLAHSNLRQRFKEKAAHIENTESHLIKEFLKVLYQKNKELVDTILLELTEEVEKS